ncbi:DUF1648 domain-containing protein [Reichenbachiella carrageenanivorans]|uniref:DUF1648 domain-containing protein n=1 Tax=Reichenbachiella carrageenanivorans TaxID=2979869 RepID=A0ABY6D2D2_9BACT|nr:DUF1648 domain-containing protein [Reichenbachiella carrageenanivorans]UXX80322.1 DUF1648 domain-containing protein [Reichenbachiella carrageenanivorans]
MSKPKLKIKLDTFDKVMETVGGLLLLLMVAYPAIQFSSVPDTIPVHFDAMGRPDRYGSKNSLWMISTIGIILYLGMIVVNKFPHTFNYLTPITARNASRQYGLATKMIRLLNVVIAAVFFAIIYGMIQTALGYSTGLGAFILPFTVAPVLIILGWYLYQANQN